VEKEREHWCKVLERLMSITQYLAERNLAFRGTSDTLFTPHNGNFLGLVELLGKFDLTMSEHLRRVVSTETHVHYCGKNVQNEIINLFGNSVQENIFNRAKSAKYFSLILDCTPDISHVEQLSFTIRFLDVEDIAIKEHFVSYKPVIETTGQGLYESILDFLRESNLDLHNCRGQGYDNGSNMKGKNKGVQARIMKENPRAFYMPCGCHSLNLVVGDSATSCLESTSFFGTVQRIYVFFSASPGRWHALKKHVNRLTAKPLCETRWECRIECVKAIKYEITGIREALYELSEMPASDPVVRHEAETLVTQIEDYGFLVMINVWYDVLGRVNVVSKTMQNTSVELSTAVSLMNSVTDYLIDYRANGYEKALESAKELATELDVEPIFRSKRISRRRRLFEYECTDEVPNADDPEKRFKNHVFNVILDRAINSLSERFEQLQSFNNTWGFLNDLKDLPDKNKLKVACQGLENKLRYQENSDINGCDLLTELDIAKELFPEDVKLPIEAARFINTNKLQDVMPNLWVALRIMLTIPITVAAGERSFSKLKLIKTYLRSSMSQDRMNSLAILCIENDIAKNINIESAMKRFADLKARKKMF
jgi:hypothetical protein